ncbi:uncharacterized protein N7518_005670 [Penicillium psychrosexuale]|uniref:uncharacterized protein n=1 Tax=Penicillium psychrosexuale TaxID=1002107 RepID=UPI002544E647|nr:uncharacterized protein N7518_005670 [Penicillium psychrosexuale]KAJ5797130.1 hypothetical protein N7518_005670 [Penicillium psychrosexuale]
MPEREPRLVLLDMIDDKITTYCPDPDDPVLSSFYKTREWVIMEKLGEEPCPITPKDSAQGMGPAFTVGKYRCYRLENGYEHGYEAIMHIYKQIPLDGTELHSLEDRKKQATTRSHVELNALKNFTENRCPFTPKLLGYQINQQGRDDLVPQGYIIYLVFEEGPGSPLQLEQFWNLRRNDRGLIREKFRVAYMEILGLGFKPLAPDLSKIILHGTGKQAKIKITGFDVAMEIDQEPKWTDYNLLIYRLALPPSRKEKYVPTGKDIETDRYGWRW